MPSISVTAIAQVPLHKLWGVWDNYPDIYLYNPGITDSYTINDTASTGLGAERQCDLPGRDQYLRERIMQHRPGERLVIDIFESSLPMKFMQATFDFRARGQNRAQVTMTMAFVPKFGPFGWLMTWPMRPIMRRQLQTLLDSAARYAETGEPVTPARLRPVAA